MISIYAKTVRVVALTAILALASALYAKAGPGGCTDSPMLFTFASETITVSSTALGFTSTVAYPAGDTPAAMAVCNVRADTVSSTTSGITPTAAIGYQTTAPGWLTICGVQNVKRFRVIRVTTDATVYCEYSREGDN